MGCELCRAPLPITDEQRERINAIIDFWYPPGHDRDLAPTQDMLAFWFGFKMTPEEQAELDKEILEKFEKDYDNYLARQYTGWPHDRDGRLAAILLLDQFPRSMFRATAKAFATDDEAARLSYKIYKNKEMWDEYKLEERHFLLLPLMHAENRSYGQTMVQAFLEMDRELAEKDSDRYNN